MQEMEHPEDKERPRANLYNIIKKLREGTVSAATIFL